MKCRLLVVVALGCLAACTDPPTAHRALENMGMTDINVGGYAAWSCGRDDIYATKFVARNPQGRIVTGAVCSGWMKGATVRFD